MNLNKQGLYAVTDTESLGSHALYVKTEEILRAGIQLLQYRNKKGKSAKTITQAKELRKLCRTFAVPFIVNDDIELAELIDADGVHLGKDDTDIKTARNKLGEGAVIGYSCYNDIKRAAHAAEAGASYIAFGAFFPSPTKPNAVKAEPNLIHEAKQIFDLPVVAIGGITPENGQPLINAGVDLLAVVSGLYRTANPYKRTIEYNNLFNETL